MSFFPENWLLVKKHSVCELDFYLACYLVPWYVLIAFLCRISECALLLLLRVLKEFLGELFGDSWPCGEEVFFY